MVVYGHCVGADMPTSGQTFAVDDGQGVGAVLPEGQTKPAGHNNPLPGHGDKTEENR